MNKTLVEFARQQIRNGLNKCNSLQHDRFKKIYSNGDTSLSITEVVNKMPDEKLDHAMQLVERTIKANPVVDGPNK